MYATGLFGGLKVFFILFQNEVFGEALIVLRRAGVDLPAQANFLRGARVKRCCFNQVGILSRDY